MYYILLLLQIIYGIHLVNVTKKKIVWNIILKFQRFQKCLI